MRDPQRHHRPAKPDDFGLYADGSPAVMAGLGQAAALLAMGLADGQESVLMMLLALYRHSPGIKGCRRRAAGTV